MVSSNKDNEFLYDKDLKELKQSLCQELKQLKDDSDSLYYTGELKTLKKELLEFNTDLSDLVREIYEGNSSIEDILIYYNKLKLRYTVLKRNVHSINLFHSNNYLIYEINNISRTTEETLLYYFTKIEIIRINGIILRMNDELIKYDINYIRVDFNEDENAIIVKKQVFDNSKECYTIIPTRLDLRIIQFNKVETILKNIIFNLI